MTRRRRPPAARPVPAPQVRALWVGGLALVVLIVVAEMLGAGPFQDRWWGVHSWAFLPTAGHAIALVALVALLLAAGRAPEGLDGALVRTLGGIASWPRPLLATLGVAGSLALFWSFREAHTLLGDGNPLTQNLPLGQSFHADEPLTLILHYAWYRLTRGWFDAPGLDPVDVARATVNLSSALCGALFVPIAWAIAREPALSAGEERPLESRATSALLFLTLLAQGTVQLFFGYVENYTYHLLALGFFVLGCLRCARGAWPLAVPAATLVLALALHLSSALLVPVFLVIAIDRLIRPGARGAALRDLAILVVLMALTQVALGRAQPGYDWLAMLRRVGSAATDSTTSYGFHRPNLSQFLNQQAVIGPLGLFLLALVAGVWATLRPSRVSADRLALAALSGVYVVASAVAGDSNLGVARNWDLLAPAGFVFTLTALRFALDARWEPSSLRRWLAVLAGVSLFHTIAWVGVNASFDRAFARFKTLPLGEGRTQATVGIWYLTHGQEADAAEWFRRSLAENPANNVAAFHLGAIAMRHDDFAFAERAFTEALRIRPTVPTYRLGLADARFRAGRALEARPELDTLLLQNPGDSRLLGFSSLLWAALGDRSRAERDLVEAQRVAPDDSSIAALRRTLDAGPQAIRRAWMNRILY